MDIKANWKGVFRNLGIILILTVIHDVLGEGINRDGKFQPFVCTDVQTKEFSDTSTWTNTESVGKTTTSTQESLYDRTTLSERNKIASTETSTSRKTSATSITTFTTNDSSSSTEETTSSTSTKVLTIYMSTQVGSIALTTVPSTQGSSDHITTTGQTTRVSTNPPTSRITTQGDTSSVSSAVDTTTNSADATTTDFTDIVSSDLSTVGSTTKGTPLASSTQASTQGSTDLSTTDLTTETTTIPTKDQTTAASCPFGYLAKFNGSCYRISNNADPILSRSDARKLCESESSHLVFIESAEEDNFLVNLLSSSEEYWIGANGLPNTFYWDDGSEMVFKKFVEDQNIAFDDQRGCYRMKVAGGSSSWPDAPCFRQLSFICEYEVGRETKQCPDDMSICSPEAFITLEYEWEQTATELQNSVLVYFDGVAYSEFKPIYASRGIHSFVYLFNDTSDDWCSFRLVTDCMTWHAVHELNTSYALVTNWLRWREAVEACIFYDSHLVSIENEEEHTSLQSLISSDVWIGLSYSADAGEWEWNRPDSTHVFFNWADDHPNNLNSCVAIDIVTAKWKTKSCGSSAPFVCERRQKK